MTDDEFLAEVVAASRRLRNVEAVALGGSRARGDARTDSDWDFAVYYRGAIDVGLFEELGWPGTVYRPFEWGQVMYGGAVFDLDGRHFDIHYRNLDVVEHWTREAELGNFEVHILGFHLAGIPTYMLTGELATNRTLWGTLPRPQFPDMLRRAAPPRWLARARNEIEYAHYWARTENPINCAGALARAVLQCAHARLAHRGIWALNEKRMVEWADLTELDETFAAIGSTTADLERAITAVAAARHSVEREVDPATEQEYDNSRRTPMAATRPGREDHTNFDAIEAAFHAALDESLEPRGPESLFDVVADLALPPGATAVDVGCGRGDHSLELARRFGLNVLGVDPVARHETTDRELAERPPQQGSVTFVDGTAESIPVENSSVDLVFCRESLMFTDLRAATTEFRRVLRPGGRGLVYLVLTGPAMSDTEAFAFNQPLGVRGLRPSDIEHALGESGLRVDERVGYGSEWGERAQERDGTAGRRLLYAARLLREPDRYITQFGQRNYDIMLGDCHWHVYRLLGKLAGYACTFTKVDGN